MSLFTDSLFTCYSLLTNFFAHEYLIVSCFRVARGGSAQDCDEGDQEGRSRGAQGKARGIGCRGGNCIEYDELVIGQAYYCIKLPECVVFASEKY